jgi:hypothetical protein
MTIINDDARNINKFDASLTDDARVIIYDHRVFIVQATGHPWLKKLPVVSQRCGFSQE